MATETDTRPEPAAAEARRPLSPHPARQFQTLVVRYDHRPNRWTICPPAPAPSELTTAWLTADAAAFYDLAEVR